MIFPPSRQQKLQLAGNLTGKSLTLAWICGSSFLTVFFENVTFPDSNQYCAFLQTNCGVRGFVNNHYFYLLSLLLNLIG